MRANADVKITSNAVTLVPYMRHHVLTYHSWMARRLQELIAGLPTEVGDAQDRVQENEALREATASERLSLEEEYDMQRNWAQDEDKCTFIVLDTSRVSESGEMHTEGMVGDVNLFFNDEDASAAEIEVMIAEPDSRRKGLAAEALQILMAYAHSDLGVMTFTAKIGFSNAASLALFMKLGYTEISRSSVFQEATLEKAVNDGNEVTWSPDWKRSNCVQQDLA